MGALVIRKLLYWMPFLFGIGFGLLFGGAWGLYANIKGRWI